MDMLAVSKRWSKLEHFTRLSQRGALVSSREPNVCVFSVFACCYAPRACL